MKIAIIFIWLREDKIINAVNMALAHAGVDHEIQVYTERCDLNNSAAINWNRAIQRTVSDVVCIIGDDCLCQPDWLANALKAMKTLPGGWGMVNFNDGLGVDRTSHVLFDRRCLDLLDGKLLHEGYFFCCSDMEMMDRMKESGHYIFARDAVVWHRHPMLFEGVESDEFYEKAYSHEERLADRALYEKRKANNWRD